MFDTYQKYEKLGRRAFVGACLDVFGLLVLLVTTLVLDPEPWPWIGLIVAAIILTKGAFDRTGTMQDMFRHADVAWMQQFRQAEETLREAALHNVSDSEFFLAYDQIVRDLGPRGRPEQVQSYLRMTLSEELRAKLVRRALGPEL